MMRGMARKSLPPGFFLLIGVALIATVLAIAALSRDVEPPQAEPLPDFTPVPMATEEVEPLPPLEIPEGASAVFFGDSWTAGYAAEPSERGYAYLAGEQLAWDHSVLGVPGTGYLNAGPNSEGTYLDRVNALPVDETVEVVVMQGSVNDEWVDQAGMYRAIEETLTAAQGKFPNAAVVVLGPSPATVPATNRLWIVNNNLESVAGNLGLHFISGMEWVTPDNWESVIDADASNHPSTAGHEYLAGRVVEAVNALR